MHILACFNFVCFVHFTFICKTSRKSHLGVLFWNWDWHLRLLLTPFGWFFALCNFKICQLTLVEARTLASSRCDNLTLRNFFFIMRRKLSFLTDSQSIFKSFNCNFYSILIYQPTSKWERSFQFISARLVSKWAMPVGSYTAWNMESNPMGRYALN